jgi:hypothetical protein
VMEGTIGSQEGLLGDVFRLRRIARLEIGVAKDSLPMTAHNRFPGRGFSGAGAYREFGFGQMVPLGLSVTSHIPRRPRSGSRPGREGPA